MTDLTHDHLFSRQFLWLKLAASVYVAALLLAHWSLPTAFVWQIAIFFSIAMNFTYPWAAWKQANSQRCEWLIATALIVVSSLSLISSPMGVIAAIFLHGCWDIAKYQGHGTPFFSWYTLGCVLCDWTYSGALLIYYLSIT
ncbi:hypothetical protein [Leptothoe kymatousa]|uniref:Uncharacterized protein n=1 Tax=Leptothoe kymatousa TAU-MAC 1615 TaxID=2364775 RepID=A0ABS5Y6J2_9CYAN|nr:hypothetical protein [Leptothoe kymatousa]MBT9313448.1 hypothetical protein [Leptothoe kymatousa TAU-MAC 1615]